MKKAMFLLIAVIFGGVMGAQIQSTAEGGFWGDPNTWVGGIVPGSGDGVMINGTVVVGPATPCNTLIVSQLGVLMNSAGTEGGVLIAQDLFNLGTIQNYAWGYDPGNLSLVIGGNLLNEGVITNHYISFNSFAPQQLGNTGWFNPGLLTDGMSTSPLILITDLVAGPGTNIDMNGSQLVLNDGTPHDLTLFQYGGNGSLTEANVIGGNGSRIICNYGPRFEQVFADDIILEGDCTIVSFTANSLENYANLFCPIYGSGDLTIIQDLRNFGSISNHPAGGSLNLYAYGPIFNYGTLSNQLLRFMGTGGRELILDDAAPAISCAVINTDGNSGDIVTYGDLRLSGCSVYLPGRTLGLGGGCGLIQTGGYISSAHIIGGIGNNLTLNSLFLQDSEITGGSLYGSFEVKNTLSLNDVDNYATIQNFIHQSANIVCNTVLGNHGTLRNHPNGGTLILSLGMNFYNYGTVTPNQINLSGLQDSYLGQDASAPAISCPNIIATSVNCVTHLLSDISFANSTIDLAGSTLVIEGVEAGFRLSLYESYLQNGEIQGFPGSTIFGQSGFLSGISANYLETEGMVFIYNTVNIDSLVNRGNIRNRDYWGGTLICSTRLDNYQNITNSLYGGSHSLEIKGDLYNYGTLSPHRVWVNGSTDQYLRNAGTSNPELGFKLVSELGDSQWYFNGSLFYSGWVTNYAVNPAVLGVWQPYNGTEFGRQITVGEGTPLLTPEGVAMLDDSGTMSIIWQQVIGANHYKVYSSTNPQTGFTLYSTVLDAEAEEGWVHLQINPSEPRRFFRVTAFN